VKIIALALAVFVFFLMVILGQEAEDNLGAAMAVGAIFGTFTAVPVVLLVAIVARNGIHIHLHKHEQPRQLREPIDGMIEGSTQVTVTRN